MAETLSIRRTLILGLGTTGKEVAEAVAEHLTWQFGGHDNAAWVRMLVLETEQPDSPLGDRVLRGGISREEYAPYLNSPRTAGASFDFFEWQDGQSLRAIDNPSAGAGNLRMLGRLCLFHPTTYDRLRRRVMSDLSELKQLTPQAVADRLGVAGLNVDIHTDTVVYVVGTLCGGTCSGGAADMGYLLKEWYGEGIDTQAIFTLPHPQLAGAKAPRYKKNAYYALKELNHFQLGNTAWLQKLPGNDSQSRRTDKPYVILRVLMPGGPDSADVRRLNVMIGQYLAAAVGPAGGAIAARDVDAKGGMETADSVGFMRPLFSTMGVAALEYPGEHILRAATMRLVSSALSRWCLPSASQERIQESLHALGSRDFDQYLQRMTEGSDRIGSAALREAFSAAAEGRPPRADQVRQLLRDLDGRLTALETPQEAPAGSPATLLQIVLQNQETFQTRLARDVDQFIDRSLFDLDGGPGFVAAVLKEQVAQIESWNRTLQESLPELRQDARSLREIMTEHLTEAEKVQDSINPFGKGDRVKHAWAAVAESVNAFLQTEIKLQAMTHVERRGLIAELLNRSRQGTALMLRRLEAIQAAFTQRAAVGSDGWKAMAADKPPINGQVYFDAEPPAARGTVTDAYYSLLRQRAWPSEPATGWDDAKKEEAAQRELIADLAPLGQQLRLPDSQSAFDPRPGRVSAQESIPQDLLAAMESRARAAFEPLRTQVHIADKAAPSDLDTVIQLSAPRLDISAAQISPQLQGARAIRPQPQNLAFLDLDRQDSRIQQMAAKIEGAIPLSRDGRVTDSHDPFRLLVIQERHGFTFGQMDGVVSRHAYDLSALQSAEKSASDFHFWHTRSDVIWIDPLISPRRVEETEEWWLQVILLGKAADGVFEWTPANGKEIEERGWYQVGSGEFRVFYPPGVPGVTDTEERLPLEFSAAVMHLLSAEYSTLRQCLSVRLGGYRDEFKEPRMVAALSEGLAALTSLGVKGLEKTQADRILRRAYARDDGLADAFFQYETDASKDERRLFAHLYKMKGQMIPDSPDEYPANAYYCPDCGHLLSDSVEALRAAHFVCPACSKRYWP